MKTFFYSLINYQEISTAVTKAGLSPQEKKKILKLIDEIILTRMIDGVLEKLPTKHHETFLEQYLKNPDDKKLMEFLKKEIDQIESHLKKVSEKTKQEIFEDIRQSLN